MSHTPTPWRLDFPGGKYVGTAKQHICQTDFADDAAFIVEACNAHERLKRWVSDLQSGMYINCVYCGHRYGPKDKVPCTMADVLKKHIEQCPEHPMSRLKRERDALRGAHAEIVGLLSHMMHTDLSEKILNISKEALALCEEGGGKG